MSEHIDFDRGLDGYWPPDATPWVLVVDDDDLIRDVVRAVLEGDGYRVLEAEDGQEALRVLRDSDHPLVVLLDVRMPGLSGLDVIGEAAHDSHLAARCTFILMTADLRAPQPTLVPLLDQLHIPVVRKPFDLDDLLATVAQASERLLPS